jgi:very-short-patch-repair endonuclease
VFARAFWLISSVDQQLPKIQISGQMQIGPYRVDFLYVCGNRRLVVECDGFEFHDRTKEQAERDKARDRDLAALGYTVMRFTGSEIWRNPFAAASEVLGFLVESRAKAA